jgi:transposase
MARPTKLTKDTSTAICEAVKRGNYIETAAALAGVHRATLYEWLKKGRSEATGIYHDFAEAMELALAESEDTMLVLIGNAAEEQWQAAAWRLERRYPEKYGRRRVEVTFPKGFDPAQLSDDELGELKSLLQKAQPES